MRPRQLGDTFPVEERVHVPTGQWGKHTIGNVHLHILKRADLTRSLKRMAGECLCPKKRGSSERKLYPGEENRLSRCSRCAVIATRHGIPWPSERRNA